MSVLMTCALLLGTFEVLSNGYHLSKGSVRAIGQSATRQHRELPLELAESHFFVKATAMFGFGLLFLLVGALFILGKDPQRHAAVTVFGLFSTYGVVQAIVYRRALNVWPAALVYSTPLVVLLLVG